MLIGELAEEVGLHPETIRRCERRGLIHAKRDVNGWRIFTPMDVERLRRLYGQREQSVGHLSSTPAGERGRRPAERTLLAEPAAVEAS